MSGGQGNVAHPITPIINGRVLKYLNRQFSNTSLACHLFMPQLNKLNTYNHGIKSME
jgi:hypothetical protein